MSDRNQLLNDPEEAFRLAMDGRLSSLWTASPGIVQKVDLTKMTCEVQMAIKGKVQDENGVVQSVNMPVLVDVPIQFPSAGSFIFTMPVAVNDEVLVIFAARCIDSWWQNGGIGEPMEARMHDLSDAFCIPGIFSQPNVVADISSNSSQLRLKDGSAYIELDEDGKVKILAPGGVEVIADSTFTGDVDITGNVTIHGLVDITGAVSITGNLGVAGNISTSGGGTMTSAGNISTSGEISGGTVKQGSVALGSHVHTGVQTGGSNTGGPV